MIAAQADKQIEYVGQGTLACLPDIIRTSGAKSLFIVHGRSSYSSSGTQARITDLLRDYALSNFSISADNPSTPDLLRAIESFRSAKTDLIIAIGGGSVIDMAKLIAAFAADPKCIGQVLTGQAVLPVLASSVLAIPTTAGSGSEATQFAVLYQDYVKYSVDHPHLRPLYVILDPELTQSLPAKLSAISGLDAMAQAIESIWAVKATDQSIHFAKQALTLLYPTIKEVVHKPNIELLDRMLRGANFSGKAINISRTTAAHALSYTLTARYGIAHGHAVAICLAALANFTLLSPNTAQFHPALNRNILNDRIGVLLEALNLKSAKQFVDAWPALIRDLNLPATLAELQLNDGAVLEEIINNINLERLKNHPIIMDKQIIRTLLTDLQIK